VPTGHLPVGDPSGLDGRGRGHWESWPARRSQASGASPDVRDDNVGDVPSEKIEIVDVHRRHDRTPSEVGHRDNKRVNGALGSPADAPKQLPGPDANARVDRIDLDSLTAQPCKDPSILTSASHDFGQDRGHGPDGELSAPHLRHESTHAISTSHRPMCNR
jgi:hypothetical protein